MVRQHILRVYSYKIADCFPEKTMENDFKALNIGFKTLQYLKKLYNGQSTLSNADLVIQDDDTLIITVSDSCVKQIEKEYFFIKETVRSRMGLLNE